MFKATCPFCFLVTVSCKYISSATKICADGACRASTEASRRNHIDALTFAARHDIRPWIEEYPMTVDGLTRALADLEAGKIRYRAVLAA